ncbi:hypothetical protein B0H17DRAFT_1211425 [Mycena rosella]|uniref:DUF659 domain-containing protein n=1 Tax=Mycena rosella TaxID=1033263 RepID=A0AAD7CUT6_MYCRO|nr:hypothetical protein B0H17DRAFT_1211425 [Mycena rosella]
MCEGAIQAGIPACLYTSAEAKAEAAKQRVETKAKRDHPDTAVAAGPSFKKHKLQLEVDQAVLKGFRRNEMPYSPAEKDLFQQQSLHAIVSGGLPLRAFEEPEMKILFGMMRTTAPGVMPTGKVVGGCLLNAAASDVEMKITKALKNRNVGLSTDGWKAKSKDSINAICVNIDFKSYLIELVEVTTLNKDGPSLCAQFAGMIDRVEVKHGCIVIYFTTDADGGSKKGRILLGKQRPWLILPSCWAHQFQLILGDYLKVNDMATRITEEATALIGWINNHSKVRTIFDESQAIISQDQALQLAVLQKRAAIIAAEVEVRKDMLIRLEKPWKDCDQPAFLLALILNPFEKLPCFGPNANLNHLKCRNLLILDVVSKAFMQYLAGTGDFADFDAEEWENLYANNDPIQAWEALAGTSELTELAKFAIIILTIVANQAGSDWALQSLIRGRRQISAQIRSEHQKDGRFKLRAGRKNHESLKTLLKVPRYRDLLDDQNQEDPAEHGHALVSSVAGWRTQMAKWVGDTRLAERAEREADDGEEAIELTPRISNRIPVWTPMTLAVLFGGAEKPRRRKPSVQAMEEEEMLMQALAEDAEDAVPDDGAIEIDSDEEYEE